MGRKPKPISKSGAKRLDATAVPGLVPIAAIGLFPLAGLVLVVVWIVDKFKDGVPLMAEPVGAGAGDTAGANAIGQWFANRDPDAIARRDAALRGGDFLAPESLPGGFKLRVIATEPPLVPGDTLVLVVDYSGTRRVVPLSLDPDGGWLVRAGVGLVPNGASVRLESGDRSQVAAGDDGGPALFRPLPVVDRARAEAAGDGKVEMVVELLRLTEAG